MKSKRRTIAKMDLKYKDRIFKDFKYDFGYEYSEDGAEYMFFTGNYSCDCNLSLFISENFDSSFEELECGDKIEILNFRAGGDY